MSRTFVAGLAAALLLTFALPSSSQAAQCVDMHTATAKEVQTLKGAGPALAKAIIDYRKAQRAKATKEGRTKWNFNNWATLMKVPGVKHKFCTDNLTKVCFGGKIQKACPAPGKKGKK